MNPSVRRDNFAKLACVISWAAGAVLALIAQFTQVGYEGTISDGEAVRSGFVLDLNGKYPKEEMTLFVPRNVMLPIARVHPGWCSLGARVAISGRIVSYHGHAEIVVASASQILSYTLASSTSMDPRTADNNAPDGSTEDHSFFFPPPAMQRCLLILDWIVLTGIIVTTVACLLLTFYGTPRAKARSFAAAMPLNHGLTSNVVKRI